MSIRSLLAALLGPLLALVLAAVPTPAALASPAGTTGAAAAEPLPQLFERALSASRAGDFAAALPLWNRVLELAPEDAAAWSNRGNVQLALGSAEAAIADQTRAMQLDPLSADPHLNRGTAEEALGRWDAAEADYRWILERDAAAGEPADASAPRSSAALAAFQLGQLEPAERELRALIRRYPLFADARAGLTALLWRRGASGEAESHWAAASGLDPRYRQPEWLLQIRRWPPEPVAALEGFLALAVR